MHTVIGDAVGSKEIVGVPEMNEGVILNSRPGDHDPGNQPEHQGRDGQTIEPIDQK
jgi:hypothetical protein